MKAAIKVETAQDLAALQERLKATERYLAIKKAQHELLRFARLQMPDPNDPGDANKSRYTVTRWHQALAEALEAVERGDHQRLIITVPPRHGKTQLTSRIFPAWYIGRDPYRSIIVASYNENLAKDFGRAVRGYIQKPLYNQIFKDVELAKGSAAQDRLETTQGGMVAFVGRGGTITGRGGDLIIIDDPLKGSEEANSQTIRDQLWDWFNNDVMTRFMSDAGAMLLVQTRWHEDDLVGRLTDPTNPHYNEEEAAAWKIINLPALAEEDDPLGRAVGEALWPERFSREYLLAQQRRDPVGFSALYQGRPSPPDGAFFKKDMIRYYKKRSDIPPNLRIYACSDHAVTTKQNNDPCCFLIVGVDELDRIWILDCIWSRMDTHKQVETMIALMRKWEIMRWFAEKAHIEKAIGPFLRKRMQEEKLYVMIEEIPTYSDKEQKAAAIQGRLSMGMVFFPEFERWCADAIQEMLKFPRGRHDDFVDCLSGIGRGLHKMLRGSGTATAKKEPKVGTWGWVKHAAEKERRTLTKAEAAGY